MFYNIKRYLIKWHRIRKWRKINLHNETLPVNGFDFDSVSVGNYTYGGIQVCNYNLYEKLKIGNFCSIASETMFVLNADHNVNTISSFPFKVKCLGVEKFEALSKGDIIVDDDVWIGYRATILSGVHIGQGAVIAAGAIVTRDVPPYAIVGGVPAKVIKYRFSSDVIEYLLSLDYGRLDEELVRDHINDLYFPINQLSLNEIQMRYKWFPKK